jgi:mRNA turnover protein 4
MQGHSDPPEPFPHSMEPQLRKLGLTTRLDRGVPTLDVEHTVCKEGDTLNAQQVCINCCHSKVTVDEPS